MREPRRRPTRNRFSGSAASPLSALAYAAAVTLAVSCLPSDTAALTFTPDSNWRANALTRFYGDSVTGKQEFQGSGSGERRWKIELGADDYFQEQYERPVMQAGVDKNDTVGVQRAYTDYKQFLDITQGAFFLDDANGVAYFGIQLFGRDKVRPNGSSETSGFTSNYRIRAGFDDTFGGGYMFGAQDPELGTEGQWASTTDNKIFRDQDADINRHAPFGSGTTGYETVVSEADPNFAVRYVNLAQISPPDEQRSRTPGWVELAVNYAGLNLDASLFSSLLFETTEELSARENYFWNDKFTHAEAGSPYTNLGVGNVGEVWELDTLLVGSTAVVPVPASMPLFLTAMALIGLLARRKTASA